MALFATTQSDGFYWGWSAQTPAMVSGSWLTNTAYRYVKNYGFTSNYNPYIVAQPPPVWDLPDPFPPVPARTITKTTESDFYEELHFFEVPGSSPSLGTLGKDHASHKWWRFTTTLNLSPNPLRIPRLDRMPDGFSVSSAQMTFSANFSQIYMTQTWDSLGVMTNEDTIITATGSANLVLIGHKFLGGVNGGWEPIVLATTSIGSTGNLGATTVNATNMVNAYLSNRTKYSTFDFMLIPDANGVGDSLAGISSGGSSATGILGTMKAIHSATAKVSIGGVAPNLNVIGTWETWQMGSSDVSITDIAIKLNKAAFNIAAGGIQYDRIKPESLI